MEKKFNVNDKVRITIPATLNDRARHGEGYFQGLLGGDVPMAIITVVKTKTPADLGKLALNAYPLECIDLPIKTELREMARVLLKSQLPASEHPTVSNRLFELIELLTGEDPPEKTIA